MGVREVTGDLFDSTADAIGHCVNCRGVMGSGIAPFFKKKYPAMYGEYKTLCQNGTLAPGLVMPWAAPTKFIYNMATQDAPGANARRDWVLRTLQAVRLHAEQHRLKSVALPRIGAGIGGLQWEDVRADMYHVFAHSEVQLRIVSLPGA